jgi:hypothetical protein
VRFEPLGYPGRLPHVLGCFLVSKHSLKRLSTPPLRVVGNPRAIEAPVDVRRDEPRLFAHYCLGGFDQHVHQTLLMPWFNGEDVDEGYHVVVLSDRYHAAPPSTYSVLTGLKVKLTQAPHYLQRCAVPARWADRNYLEPDNMFVTCFYAILDPESGNLSFANAGHDLPYLRRGGDSEELRARGIPLGLCQEWATR